MRQRQRAQVAVHYDRAERVAGAARDHHRLPVPTYSPELNPCEMVFGYVKNSLLTFAIVAQHVLRRDQRALSPDHVCENGAIPRALP